MERPVRGGSESGGQLSRNPGELPGEAEKLRRRLRFLAEHAEDMEISSFALGETLNIAEIARETLSLLPPASVPDGWVAVPREPTPEMCCAFLDAEEVSPMHEPFGAFEDAYRAMLSTAPPVPVSGWREMVDAPRDGTRVDLWVLWPEDGTASREADAYWNADAEEWQLGQYHAGQYVERPIPTHWQPLPHPPQSGEG